MSGWMQRQAEEAEDAVHELDDLRAELSRTKAEQRAAYLDGEKAVAAARKERDAVKRQLAKVTEVKQKYFDLLADQCDKNDTLEAVLHVRTEERDRLHYRLFGHAPPEPAKPLTPADRVMLALRSRDKADAERTLDQMHPIPEAKPEAPKCSICGGPQNHQWTCGGTGRAQ